MALYHGSVLGDVIANGIKCDVFTVEMLSQALLSVSYIPIISYRRDNGRNLFSVPNMNHLLSLSFGSDWSWQISCIFRKYINLMAFTLNYLPSSYSSYPYIPLTKKSSIILLPCTICFCKLPLTSFGGYVEYGYKNLESNCLKSGVSGRV